MCASTWRRIERIDEIGTRLVQVEWVKGHATMQHARAGTISLWQLQANELADEQGKKGSALHPSVAQVKQSYTARTLLLGWLASNACTLSQFHKIECEAVNVQHSQPNKPFHQKLQMSMFK